VEAWLCLQHFDVGGPPTAECPDAPDAIRAAFARARQPTPFAVRKASR
jgi:hypothetical protein